MGLRGKTLAAVAGLVAIGLFAASPFLCKRLVGTGESFNYSLSVADAVAQIRDGSLPPLAGQSLYAFNGRIHPLRNAPYLYYLAAGLDYASLHRLTVWQLQNASLALSLLGAGLACYLGLRRGAQCPPLPAFLLSALYLLAPSLLGAAHTFDLYMTVHVAVFVPLAIAACVRSVLRPSFSADAWMAAALAAAWLAHPPVALWLTVGVVIVRLAAFASRPSWKVLASGTLAAVLCACLCAFVFASVAAVDSSTGTLSTKGAGSGIPALIMDRLHDSVPGSLLPVTRDAGALGGLQFGYAAWLLLALTLAALARPVSRPEGAPRGTGLASVSCAAYAALMLVMTLPVPGITSWIWRHVPGVALELTTIWPMQRLYLVATGFTVFGAALVLPGAWQRLRHPRWLGPLLVLVAAAWVLYEADAFVQRGKRDRRSQDATLSSYRPSNLDLTVTSYAFFGVPPTYVSGVMDPQFEFRLLRNGTEQVGSPLESAAATAPVVERVTLRMDRVSAVTLKPGKRYLATFDFHTQPMSGLVEFKGALLYRTYSLPSAGAAAGFGMNGGQRRSIPIWTDASQPERVEIRIDIPELNSAAGRLVAFADVALQEVQPERLPVRLEGLVPLKFAVDAPQAGLTVETPRLFLAGYEATVNGRRVTPLMSPYRLVMIPVPPGHSEVVLECTGPAFVPFAFWVSAASWAALLVWRLAGSWVPADPRYVARRGAGMVRNFIVVHWVSFAIAAACVVVGIIDARRDRQDKAFLEAVGPVSIDFTLPYGQTGSSQPLLSTGRAGAGAVVFVHYMDERHVRIEADVWGSLHQSGPIELDYSQVQNLVVSDSALYPLAHPAVQALSPSEVAQLRGELRVELNGSVVMQEKCFAYETLPSEIQVGATTFVSVSSARFLGEIVGVRRLLIPRTLALPGGRRAHIVVRFPKGREGTSEPVAAISSGGSTRACYVSYLTDRSLRLTEWSPGHGVLSEAEVAYDPQLSHELDLTTGEADDRTLDFDVACRFDGTRLFGRERVHPPGKPAVVASGVNSAAVPGVRIRFTGPQLDLSLVRDAPAPPAADTGGPLHLVVMLPLDRTGRHEPLLTSGHTGAADMVYVIYADEGHIRIGYDHWGVGGAISGPIAVDYKEPHELWISMASLDPVSAAHPSPTVVVMDGQTIITSAIKPYPAPPAELTVAQNRIGASTADPDFSGTVQFAERGGAMPAPGQRL
jgi:hypothetical protein